MSGDEWKSVENVRRLGSIEFIPPNKIILNNCSCAKGLGGAAQRIVYSCNTITTYEPNNKNN